MYHTQDLVLCIEFGPVREDSVRHGGGDAVLDFYQVTCDCLLPFVHPLLSQVCIVASNTGNLESQDSTSHFYTTSSESTVK